MGPMRRSNMSKKPHREKGVPIQILPKGASKEKIKVSWGDKGSWFSDVFVTGIEPSYGGKKKKNRNTN